MKQLILEHEVTDGYTYSCTRTLPILYESAEALLVDFLEAAKSALTNNTLFVFLGQTFTPQHFYAEVPRDFFDEPNSGKPVIVRERHFLETPPTILTVEEFFERALKP